MLENLYRAEGTYLERKEHKGVLEHALEESHETWTTQQIKTILSRPERPLHKIETRASPYKGFDESAVTGYAIRTIERPWWRQ